MAVAMVTRHRREENVDNETFGQWPKYFTMMEHVAYMVAIDTGNGQQQDLDNNEVPCPTLKGHVQETCVKFYLMQSPVLK